MTQVLTAGELQQQLALLGGWALADGALEKRFLHKDFARTMAFVNAVAWIAECEDHHPEVQLGWGRCTLRWWTHRVGGITMLDVRCAARVDALMQS